MPSRTSRRPLWLILLALSLGLALLAPAAGAGARTSHPAKRRHHRTHRRRVHRHRHPRSHHQRSKAKASVSRARPLPGPAPAPQISFNGNFDAGNLGPWASPTGGAQCADYGVPSANYHQRGNVHFDSSVVGQGHYSMRFDLPANTSPYTTSICELLHPVGMGLGTDAYYGSMYYVPPGWTPGTSAFWGVGVASYHFENVWGAPVGFELHSDHMTLALETGPCQSVFTSNPGCQYRSMADLAGGPSLPGYYVIPPRAFVPGHWYEVILHVRWAADSSGNIQTWYREKGAQNWIESANVTGIPTVQWNAGQAPPATAFDKVGAYRAYSTVPIAVWIDNVVQANSLFAVAATMP